MNKCGNCGFENDDVVTRCDKCGVILPPSKNKTVPKVPAVSLASSTKKCPYCAEEIKIEAVYCRFCQHDLHNSVLKNPDKNVNYQLPVDEKKKTPFTTKVILFFTLLIIGLCIYSIFFNKDSSPPRKYPTLRPTAVKTATAVVYKVTYEITGTANKVSITLANESDNTEQFDNYVPFRQTMIFNRGQFYYISAQNDGETGSVTCNIYVNDELVETATSSGAYKIASCSGSTP